MLRWMQLSIVGLMLLALMVPFAIFAPAEWNGLLFVIAIAIYFVIFYLVDSFCYYLTSNAPQKTQEAEESRAEEEQTKAVQEVTEQTTRAIEQWIVKGGHRTAGITSPVAAAEMGIARYQLTAWVKQRGYESFSRWMTALRIDEAKRVLLEHPDWGSEAVADYCGFNSRQYFHTVFRQHTGVTPAQYQQQHGVVGN